MLYKGEVRSEARNTGLWMERFIVYILISRKDNNLYIGYTGNLTRRLKQHNSGKVKSTKGIIPLELLYTEEFDTRNEAHKKELFYKTPKGKRVLKNKLGDRLMAGHGTLDPVV